MGWKRMENNGKDVKYWIWDPTITTRAFSIHHSLQARTQEWVRKTKIIIINIYAKLLTYMQKWFVNVFVFKNRPLYPGLLPLQVHLYSIHLQGWLWLWVTWHIHVEFNVYYSDLLQECGIIFMIKVVSFLHTLPGVWGLNIVIIPRGRYSWFRSWDQEHKWSSGLSYCYHIKLQSCVKELNICIKIASRVQREWCYWSPGANSQLYYSCIK